MCLRADEHAGVFETVHEDAITTIINEIRSRDGDISISISGLNQYAEGVTCSATGSTGVAVTAAVADWAVGNIANVTRGPDTGPLTTDQLDVDNCHLNDIGIDFVGAQLVSSFDFGDTDPADPPPLALNPGSVAVIGCSNTSQHIDGYLAASDADILAGPQNLAGGSLIRWQEAIPNATSRYWASYEALRPAEGYSMVWMQVCYQASEHNGLFTVTHELAVSDVVGEIRKRDGNIPILVSPLNSYEAGHVCTATGAEGVDIAAETADWAAANLADVDRGPDTGPVSAADLLVDGCHLNDSGIAIVGAQLTDALDG